MANLRLLIICAALATAWPFGAVLAQADYPSRLVTIVIPYAPGGTLEAEIRLYSEKMRESLRQPFIVDHKPGAAAALGTAYVAKAAPDGYTLAGIVSAFTAPTAIKPPMFDPIRDFAPVSLLSKQPSVLVASPALPVKSMGEYVAYARANPGKVNFGAAGGGSITHIAGAWIQGLIGSRAEFVHFKGGNELPLALMGNHVDVGILPAASAMPLARAGKVRALGLTETSRLAMVAGVPAIGESLQGYGWSQWQAILAPARTPAPIVNKLSQEISRISRLPEVYQKLDSVKEVVGSNPQVLRELIASEVPRWAKIVQDNDIKLQD